MQPFHDGPAEVEPTGAARSDEVDLLPGILPHVGYPKIVGCSIKAVTPGVAQPERPYLAAHCLPVPLRRHPRVVGWDRVGLGGVAHDIDAQHFAQERLRVLAVAEPVVGCTAVTRAHPEHAVGAKEDHAAVVVRCGLLEG